MQLTSIDWVIVAVSLFLCYLPALYYIRRSQSSVAEFFTSGQSAPWWLVGTSMVATTFSTDTPNLVTDFVRSHGVSNNWVWWAFLLTGMATVFFYAQLWRRSGVLTDLEFYELRYSGRPAALVRGFRAVYLGFFFNIFIMPLLYGVLSWGWIIVGLLFLVYWPIFYFYKKNKVAITNWIEKEALYGEEPKAAPVPVAKPGAA